MLSLLLSRIETYFWQLASASCPHQSLDKEPGRRMLRIAGWQGKIQSVGQIATGIIQGCRGHCEVTQVV